MEKFKPDSKRPKKKDSYEPCGQWNQSYKSHQAKPPQPTPPQSTATKKEEKTEPSSMISTLKKPNPLLPITLPTNQPHFSSPTFPFPLSPPLFLHPHSLASLGFSQLPNMSNLAETAPNPRPNIPTLKLIDSSLRLSVIPLTVATIWLTVTNQQDNISYGNLEFGNLTGLKYMVCVSGISAGYALVAVVASWVRCVIINKSWVFFVSDQVIAYLMITSGAAVLEIVYLAYKGDRAVTWSEACASYGRFCRRVNFALAFHALALSCFLVLAVISAYRVFSMFDPPLPSKELEEDGAS